MPKKANYNVQLIYHQVDLGYPQAQTLRIGRALGYCWRGAYSPMPLSKAVSIHRNE